MKSSASVPIHHHHRRCQHGTRRWLSTIGPIAHLSAPALHDLCICMGLSSILFKLLSAAGGGGAHRRRRRLPTIPRHQPLPLPSTTDSVTATNTTSMSRYGAQAVDASAVVAGREREKNRESAVMSDATSEIEGSTANNARSRRAGRPAMATISFLLTQYPTLAIDQSSTPPSTNVVIVIGEREQE